MIVASMSITEERKKAADFSDSYYDIPSRWVGKTGMLAEWCSSISICGRT